MQVTIRLAAVPKGGVAPDSQACVLRLRWFSAADVEVPEAKFLDVILYSREQLVQEYEAMPGKGDPAALPPAPWGIISIKAQDEDFETPMQVCYVPMLHAYPGFPQCVAMCAALSCFVSLHHGHWGKQDLTNP
jgi:hypothetical protein